MFPHENSDHVAHITWHLSISTDQTWVFLPRINLFLGSVDSPRFSLVSPAPWGSSPGASRSRPPAWCTHPSSRHRHDPWNSRKLRLRLSAANFVLWPKKGFLDFIQPLLCVGLLHVLDKGEEVVPLSLELGARVHLRCHHLQIFVRLCLMKMSMINWQSSIFYRLAVITSMNFSNHHWDHLLYGHLDVVHPLNHLADPSVVYILDERVVLAPERHAGNWNKNKTIRFTKCDLQGQDHSVCRPHHQIQQRQSLLKSYMKSTLLSCKILNWKQITMNFQKLYSRKADKRQMYVSLSKTQMYTSWYVFGSHRFYSNSYFRVSTSKICWRDSAFKGSTQG